MTCLLVICQDVCFKIFLDVSLSKTLHLSADREWHWLDLALCLLFNTESFGFFPRGGERRGRKEPLKQKGLKKQTKLELVYRTQHCSTCYKGRLSVSVPVPLHMADSQYKIEMRGCWSQEMGVWFGRDVFCIGGLWRVRAKAAVSTQLRSGVLKSCLISRMALDI